MEPTKGHILLHGHEYLEIEASDLQQLAMTAISAYREILHEAVDNSASDVLHWANEMAKAERLLQFANECADI
jgi:hypothetical protein